MRNDTRAEKIISLVEKMPYFELKNLAIAEKNQGYLKIILSRYEKTGKLIRLKKGLYVNADYLNTLEKRDLLSFYTEFIAGLIYSPSYLSLEYVLYEHNILSEIPKNFTSISAKKTMHLKNNLGDFFYHKIAERLFAGFKIITKGDFVVFKATKAKALFDYLYLRQDFLISPESFAELRLNLDNLTKGDLKEFKKYLKIEGSKKMYAIAKNIFAKFNC
jgi:predicted transcriptional regulator of viral defense system